MIEQPSLPTIPTPRYSTRTRTRYHQVYDTVTKEVVGSFSTPEAATRVMDALNQTLLATENAKLRQRITQLEEQFKAAAAEVDVTTSKLRKDYLEAASVATAAADKIQCMTDDHQRDLEALNAQVITLTAERDELTERVSKLEKVAGDNVLEAQVLRAKLFKSEETLAKTGEQIKVFDEAIRANNKALLRQRIEVLEAILASCTIFDRLFQTKKFVDTRAELLHLWPQQAAS